MEDDLNCLQMEGDLKFACTWKTTYFCKWKTTLFFFYMEDNLNCFQMEEDLNVLVNQKQPEFILKIGRQLKVCQCAQKQS